MILEGIVILTEEEADSTQHTGGKFEKYREENTAALLSSIIFLGPSNVSICLRIAIFQGKGKELKQVSMGGC